MPKTPFYSFLSEGTRLFVVSMALGLLAACQQSPAPSGGGFGPLPVTVSLPLTREITDWDEYTGRTEAVEEVAVRARVSGYLESVHFKDGAPVAEGDLLFVIDPRPYQAALDQAKAALEQARARQQLADNEFKRAQRLFGSRAIAEEELDNRTQALHEAEAGLEEAQAALTAAQLNLEFTEVRAPISGRISRKRVTEGNLISGGSADSTLLTTIVSLDPIYVYFTADERAYLRYVRLDQRGQRPSSRTTANPVRMRLADETGFPHQGRMDFVDIRIDEASGTMEGRALFANPDGLLIPGLFVRLQLLGEGPYQALVIPDAAIGTDQSQRFVYVVGDDHIAQRRTIIPGQLVDGLRVIRAGLTATDQVIVNGLMRVRPDSEVIPMAAAVETSATHSDEQQGSAARTDEAGASSGATR